MVQNSLPSVSVHRYTVCCVWVFFPWNDLIKLIKFLLIALTFFVVPVVLHQPCQRTKNKSAAITLYAWRCWWCWLGWMLRCWGYIFSPFCHFHSVRHDSGHKKVLENWFQRICNMQYGTFTKRHSHSLSKLNTYNTFYFYSSDILSSATINDLIYARIKCVIILLNGYDTAFCTLLYFSFADFRLEIEQYLFPTAKMKPTKK